MTNEWADGLTPNVLESIFYKALAAKDFEGVTAALTVMATRDAERAGLLFDTLKVGIAWAREDVA